MTGKDCDPDNLVREQNMGGCSSASSDLDKKSVDDLILEGLCVRSPVDGPPTMPSLRTLGVGAEQAAAGNDPRFAFLDYDVQYVHPLGDNANSGTYDQPKRTASAAYNALADGGTIYVTEGTKWSDGTEGLGLSDGQGCWITGLAIKPPGFLGQKTFQVVGFGTKRGGQFGTWTVKVNWGVSSLAGGVARRSPGIWLAGTTVPITFDGILVITDQPARLFWDYRRTEALTVADTNITSASRSGTSTVLTVAFPAATTIVSMSRTNDFVTINYTTNAYPSFRPGSYVTVDPGSGAGMFSTGTFVVTKSGGTIGGGNFSLTYVDAGSNFGNTTVTGASFSGHGCQPGDMIETVSNNSEFPGTAYLVTAVTPNTVTILDVYGGFKGRSATVAASDVGTYALQLRGLKGAFETFQNCNLFTTPGGGEKFAQGPTIDRGDSAAAYWSTIRRCVLTGSPPEQRAIVLGPADSVVAATGTWRFDNGAFTQADVGTSLFMSGASAGQGANNGIRVVTGVPDSTHVTTANAGLVDETLTGATASVGPTLAQCDKNRWANVFARGPFAPGCQMEDLNIQDGNIYIPVLGGEGGPARMTIRSILQDTSAGGIGILPCVQFETGSGHVQIHDASNADAAEIAGADLGICTGPIFVTSSVIRSSKNNDYATGTVSIGSGQTDWTHYNRSFEVDRIGGWYANDARLSGKRIDSQSQFGVVQGLGLANLLPADLSDSTKWNHNAAISVTGGQAAPDGSAGAFLLSGGGYIEVLWTNLEASIAALQVGDSFVFGCWAKMTNGASLGTVVGPGGASGTGINRLWFDAQTQLGAWVLWDFFPPFGGDGEWQWLTTRGEAPRNDSTLLRFQIYTPTTNGLLLYQPTLLYLPRASYSLNEAARLASSFRGFPKYLPAGRAGTMTGQMLIAHGGLGIASTIPKIAGAGSGQLTVGSIVSYEPRYADDGVTILGWVPLYSATVNP